MKPRHLYVHVPFCVRRCSYCDFAVSALRDPPVPAWLEAIGTELSTHAGSSGRDDGLVLDTIYVGGGTPSLIGVGGMGSLADRLRAGGCSWSAGIEWTAEANPESFSAVLAEDWLEAGTNRLSLGAQTFHAPALQWMGRLQGPEGPQRAVAAARSAGFSNISVDLIFGLPSRLRRDWTIDLEKAIELDPEHVSLYGLTAEASTPLGRWVREGKETLADDDTYESEYLEAVERLTGAGYVQYEVSNFARAGLDSRHNRAYWEGAPYLGLGPGAHSFVAPRRWWNVRDWVRYAELLAAGGSAVDGEERIGPEEGALERAWLGLRTDRGIAAVTGAQAELSARWHEQGWAEVRDGVTRLTPRGWLLLDRLAVEFNAAEIDEAQASAGSAPATGFG